MKGASASFNPELAQCNRKFVHALALLIPMDMRCGAAILTKNFGHNSVAFSKYQHDLINLESRVLVFFLTQIRARAWAKLRVGATNVQTTPALFICNGPISFLYDIWYAQAQDHFFRSILMSYFFKQVGVSSSIVLPRHIKVTLRRNPFELEVLGCRFEAHVLKCAQNF